MAPEQVDALIARTSEARTHLERESSAKWWIDHRWDVNRYVHDARMVAFRSIFADLLAERERRAEEERERARAASEAERRARVDRERAEEAARRESENAAAEQACTFKAVAVQRHGREDFSVCDEDGRVVRGWIEDDEWCLYAIDEQGIDSLHPEAERIAEEARVIYMRRRRR